MAIKTVMNLHDFVPSPDVNAAFSSLVASVVQATALPTWCNDEVCREVQRRCSLSESEMEMYWSRRITGSARPQQELETFWYIDNYRELVRREIGLMGGSGLMLSNSSRVAMIGSGPLPLTAWCLWHQTGAAVDLVDVAPVALTQSRELARAIAWPVGECLLADGAAVALPDSAYDVMYVAGLAGDSVEAKQQIIDNILPALRPGGRIIVRGAHGAKTLLYPAFDPNSLRRVQLLVEYNPDDDIINSVYVYKKG
ncbi:nicotianamine synthase family protein [Candidatus Nanosynbacter sp. BB002]|uniref:nicotianamine synthase family protein n=1 Tax=Candidatus Nanosynbacter sp. BB002 TaxID=3393757 RepID=UPI0030D23264